MVFGVTGRSPRPASCTSRSSPISSRRAPSRKRTAPTGIGRGVERALFVIDGNGSIYWSYLSPIGVNPGADGILEALESLSATPRPA